MTEAERRIVRCYAAGFQEMEDVVQAKDASKSIEDIKGKETDSFLKPSSGTQLCWPTVNFLLPEL